METLVAGRRAHWTTGGRESDPELPSMVFVHGAGHDGTVWQLQTRYFANHGYRVFALDLPGHGRSEGPALTSIEACAEWIGDFLQATDAGAPVLVGHSMGSLIALEHAAARPPAALCLVGTTQAMAVHPELQAAADADDHRAMELITGWSLGPSAQRGGHRTPGLWMRGGSLRLLERTDPGVLATDLAACSAYDRALERAAAVTAPTLLLLGARDQMTPARAAGPLAAALPNCRTVTLEGAGHTLMTECPDEVIDELAAFLG